MRAARGGCRWTSFVRGERAHCNLRRWRSVRYVARFGKLLLRAGIFSGRFLANNPLAGWTWTGALPGIASDNVSSIRSVYFSTRICV